MYLTNWRYHNSIYIGVNKNIWRNDLNQQYWHIWYDDMTKKTLDFMKYVRLMIYIPFIPTNIISPGFHPHPIIPLIIKGDILEMEEFNTFLLLSPKIKMELMWMGELKIKIIWTEERLQFMMVV